MSDLLYEKYQTLEQDELFDIILNPENYQKEAIPVARQVISERGWSAELKKKQEEEQKENAIEEENYQLEIEEKAAYYKNVVEFKNQGNAFQIKIPDIPKLESALEEKGIPFFREDKNIGVQLDTFPTQTYYFKDEDAETVDNLTKELGLITAPYADAKPFFGFELKVVAIVIGLTLLVILLFS